ncbi:SDR family NAD(P)-dependent oxidoreductase [Streptomyces sp. NPDC059104]|uniref:type I polyketide synthase n=1 Tax=Streptomyces sp. NPDC059104 TaxID=3346729 RepID=UPI0036CB1EA5
MMLEPIAVIGLAGRFPGACNVQQFWLNLRDGKESVSFLSDEELLEAGVPAEWLTNPAYVKARPMLPGMRDFDASFFGMTPREAQLCDPQLRLFLESAHGAIENAGYDPATIRESVGVFGSATANEYAALNIRTHPDYANSPGEMISAFNNVDYLATFSSYKLNLRGPSMSVVTACSSSLVAVHLASQALRLGECDLALAGGAGVELPYGHGHWWTPGSVRTKDGHCRPFDAQATGTIFGSGAAVVMLKRLSDAIADGDSIRAVIRGLAVNNDGSDKVSFSAPSVAGQVACIQEALTLADLRPSDISYVEAHGTGTALGDPIEVSALRQAWSTYDGSELLPGSCPIGSVKSNVGHLGPVAGIAGMIKVILSLENEQLPASINYTEPNPKLELEKTPFFVNDRLRPWKRDASVPRRAAMSSLGIGGTNVHAIIEEAPVTTPAPDDRRPRVVVWSGKTVEAEEALRAKLAEDFGWHGRRHFAESVATLQRGRAAHKARGAVVVNGAEAAAQLLGTDGDGGILRTSPGRSKPRIAPEARPVAFLFPGQGAQYPGMAAGLYGMDKTFTHTLDTCLEILREHGMDLRATWQDTQDTQDAATLARTENAQPLLFAVEYSLARMWQAWGIEPAALVGHSVGEMAAATIAGVFELRDALRLIALRSRAMQAMPPGAMLAVAAPAEKLQDLLGDEVSLAAANGPGETVLSGTPEALAAVREALAGRRIAAGVLPASHAFHSPSMAPAVQEYLAGFADVTLNEPRIPLYSAAAGALLTPEDALRPEFWAQQLVNPVRFAQALDAALADGDRALVEVGPGQTLIGLARRLPALREKRSIAVPSLPRDTKRGEDDLVTALTALAKLWVEGQDVDWAAVDQDTPLRRVPVPGYAYQRTRHWIESQRFSGPVAQVAGVYGAPPAVAPVEEPPAAVAPAVEPPAREAAPAAEPAAATPEVSPFGMLSWVEEPRDTAGPERGRNVPALALLPENPQRALSLQLVLQRSGYRPIRVRPGTHYAAKGEEFWVRPGEPEDLAKVVADVTAQGLAPEVLVHAWSADTWDAVDTDRVDEQLDLTVHSLFALIQQGARTAVRGKMPSLLTLTTRSVDLTGTEHTDLVKATLHGIVRTAAQELPGVQCTLIDVAPGTPDAALVDEIRNASGGVVALRGLRRWTRRELPYTPQPGNAEVIRPQGVYLVTGGLGGLGLEVASRLAGTGMQPRILLLGRRGLPQGAEADPAFDTVRAAIAEMEALGAEVRVLACDVANERALRRALDTATAHFGRVNGVLHLAGLPGDGMIHFRDRAQVADVLRPKVQGTLLLERLLREQGDLDFFISFASRAGVGGLVGSADYAAANAFLDAHATATTWTRALSVDWPSWAEVGMAADSAADVSSLADVTAVSERLRNRAVEWETTVAADTHWVLDEHRAAGVALLPGTGHLDLLLSVFREKVAPSAEWRTVRFADVVFRRPLVAREARRVRLTYTPDGESWTFGVDSQPTAEPRGAWTTHVTGRIATSEGTARRVDLDELRSRLEEQEPPARRPAHKRLFTLGPRWQNAGRTWAADGEKLVEITLPEAFADDRAGHPLHPTMLDTATASARDAAEPFHLPFLYGALSVYQALPQRLLSHIRRRPEPTGTITADVTLIGEDGLVVAEIEGFTMRLVEGSSFLDTPEPAAAGGPAAPRADGVSPRQGVQLLFELLESRTPAQVTVRPYRGGRPVELSPVFAGSAERAVPGTGAGEIPAPAAVAESVQPVAAVPPVAGEIPAPTAAGASVEERLRGVWEAVLGAMTIELDDDFFDLGGNSLTAVEMMSRIRDTFAVELSIGSLFEYRTLTALAGVLRDQGAR